MKDKNFMNFLTFKNIATIALIISILGFFYGEKINLIYAEDEILSENTEEVLGIQNESQTEEEDILETTPVTNEEVVTVEQPTEPTLDQAPVAEARKKSSTEEDFEEQENEEYTESPIYVPPKNIKVVDISLKNKTIPVDKLADHSCSMEFFSVHMSQRDLSEQKIFIKSNKRFTKDISISELPQGFVAYFKKNNKPSLNFTSDDSLVLVIQKSENAQKGNFNIPIVVTENESKKSTQICQLNLINE